MVDLYAENQSVTIFADVSIFDGTNTFEASVGLNGSVNYSSTGMLSVKDPSIVKFDITENTLLNTPEAIENIKNTLGRQVPVEVSFNAQAMNLGGLNLSPKSLRIIDNGLVLTL
jgi:2-methylaconitate cis-trans-isomerase PrpF